MEFESGALADVVDERWAEADDAASGFAADAGIDDSVGLVSY